MIDMSSLKVKNFEEEDRQNIKNFLEVINKVDGIEISVSDEMIDFVLKTEPMRKSMFLSYLDGKLVAYSACAIHDHDKEKANLELLVHPDYRSKGIGSHLYEKLNAAAITANVKRMRCSTKESLTSTVDFIKARGFEPYQYMWSMDRELTAADGTEFTIDGCTINKFGEDEMSDYIHLMNSGFKKENEVQYNDKSFDFLFNDPDAYIFFIKKDGKPVATAAVRIQKDISRGYIQNVTVFKDFRGLRLGEMLLSHCIHYIKEAGMTKASLSVNGQNENALRLYRKLGFKEIDTEISFMKVL